MSYVVNFETLRSARANLDRQQATREAKFKADKAELEGRMRKLEEDFARDVQRFEKASEDLATAEAVYQMLARGEEAAALSNGDARVMQSKPPPGAGRREADDDEDEDEPETDKEKVLAAVRALHAKLGRGVYRHEIRQYIAERWGAIPGTSISTYLARLKSDGLAEHFNLLWSPVEERQ